MENSREVLNTKVLVEFVQDTKQGESVVKCRPLDIPSDLMSEISGAIVRNVTFTRLQLMKYKGKIKGFSFNRKFGVRIQIGERAPVTLSDVFGLESNVKQTLILKNNTEEKDYSARNKAVMLDFADKINDMVYISMTEVLESTPELDEAKDDMIEHLEAVSPKYLSA